MMVRDIRVELRRLSHVFVLKPGVFSTVFHFQYAHSQTNDVHAHKKIENCGGGGLAGRSWVA